MMRLARRAALLVAFSLLTSAATASAECAWMLWYELNSFGLAPGQNWTTPTHWAFVGGYQTLDACQKQEALKIETLSTSDAPIAGLKQTAKTSGNVITKHWEAADGSSAGTTTTRYVCLPDTIDPRGPRGK
jgi:hypothetical protein